MRTLIPRSGFSLEVPHYGDFPYPPPTWRLPQLGALIVLRWQAWHLWCPPTSAPQGRRATCTRAFAHAQHPRFHPGTAPGSRRMRRGTESVLPGSGRRVTSGHVTHQLSRGCRSPDQAVTWPGPLGRRRPAGHGRNQTLVFSAAGGSVRWEGHGAVALAPIHPDLQLALHHLPAQLSIQVPRQFGRAAGLLRPGRGFPPLP